MRIKYPKNKIKCRQFKDYSNDQIRKVLGEAVADYFLLVRFNKGRKQ